MVSLLLASKALVTTALSGGNGPSAGKKKKMDKLERGSFAAVGLLDVVVKLLLTLSIIFLCIVDLFTFRLVN